MSEKTITPIPQTPRNRMCVVGLPLIPPDSPITLQDDCAGVMVYVRAVANLDDGRNKLLGRAGEAYVAWTKATWLERFLAACACEHLWAEKANEIAHLATKAGTTGQTAAAAQLLEDEADAVGHALGWHEIAKTAWDASQKDGG